MTIAISFQSYIYKSQAFICPLIEGYIIQAREDKDHFQDAWTSEEVSWFIKKKNLSHEFFKGKPSIIVAVHWAKEVFHLLPELSKNDCQLNSHLFDSFKWVFTDMRIAYILFIQR